jgi:hypothetical protein
MFELNSLPFICLESRDGERPKASSLKEALVVGAEIREAKRAALGEKLQDRQELNKLSTEPPQETNKLFLKSVQDTLGENILSLKELSKFNQNNHTAKTMLNKEKRVFLNNLKKAHSLSLLKVVPSQQEELDIKSPVFISGEIQLHHSIDPSYLSSSRDRSKLYFMIMNDENLRSGSKPVLRIFSDEGNRENPFYNFNAEFTDTLGSNKTNIDTLFKSKDSATASNISTEQFKRLIDYFQKEGLPDRVENVPQKVIKYDREPQALEGSRNHEIRQQLNEESRNEHNRLLKLFQEEDRILEYLFEAKLGKIPSPRDNLNLLKSINELLSAQKSEPLARSGQIQSGEAFDGRPFYIERLFNTSPKPLDFHRGFINTGNLKIEFLIFNNKDKNSIPKLNLKLTDTIRGHSKSFLLDAEVAPELKNSFREYLNNFITFIEKKESKLRSTNSPQLKRPEPPPSKA